MLTRKTLTNIALYIGLWCIFCINTMQATKNTDNFLNTTAGVGGTYNFNTKAKGFLGRVDAEIIPRTKIIVEYVYFPKYKSDIPEYKTIGISEYYVQSFIAFNTIEYKGFKTFIGMGGSASKWINNGEFARAASRKMNFSGDAILGVQQQIKKINLFSEFRYNLYWGEYHIQAGIGLCLLQKSKNKSARNSTRDLLACPNFNF